MFTTYVLRSVSTGHFYTGSTSDFDARMKQHNSDLSTSTKNRGPWELLYREEFKTRAEAMARERYFKTGAGRDELNAPGASSPVAQLDRGRRGDPPEQ
jgi:putative endonuclease